jgi:hypothetical protein
VPRQRQQPWTKEDVLQAVKLKDSGLKVAQIADRMGRPVGSVQQYLFKHRHNLLPYKHEEWAKRREWMLRLYLLGMDVTDIALLYRTATATVHNCLSREGFDPEMREQYRKEVRAFIESLIKPPTSEE